MPLSWHRDDIGYFWQNTVTSLENKMISLKMPKSAGIQNSTRGVSVDISGLCKSNEYRNLQHTKNIFSMKKFSSKCGQGHKKTQIYSHPHQKNKRLR